jgi:tRNA threonylcarbamoyladenosine biosynthesis protein TsaE
MERVFLAENKTETQKVAETLGLSLSGGEIIFLKGDLGAGKTAFVGGLLKGLGINADATSPTFSLVNEYKGEKTLYHFDMYRINTEEELYSIGFYDYLGSGAVIAIEWAENVIDYLPKCDISVKIEKTGENERKIILRGDTLK